MTAALTSLERISRLRARHTLATLPGHTRIGMLLIEAGRLDEAGVDRILLAQRERGRRFGEVGISLGLLTQSDVDAALARQFDHPCLNDGDDRISLDVVTAFARPSPLVEQFRTLRSQLMFQWFTGGPRNRSLAITGLTRREGRSFIAANLAVAFAQLRARTLLVDADLRHPAQAGLFRLEQRVGLSNVLAGRAGREAIVQLAALPNLSVLPAGGVAPNPQELLGGTTFARLLETMRNEFDVVLIDTPAASECADAQTIAASAGATLVVARRHTTSASELATFGQRLQQAGVVLVGSALNDG